MMNDKILCDTELQRSSWMYCSDDVDDENSIVSEESNERNDESELLEKSRTSNGGKLVWAADDALPFDFARDAKLLAKSAQ